MGLEAPLLEVIAITPEDALAAELGGADRLEVVSEIGVGGLTPDLDQFQRIREAVSLPLRVMLRTNDGFQVTPSELERMHEQIAGLRQAGASEFVFGFLDDSGGLDLGALSGIRAAIARCPWTLHHALDRAVNPASAWEAARRLPGLDCILTGGLRGDLGQGLQTLCDRADWQAVGPVWLAGGGLVLDYVEPLRKSGIGAFHIGRAARKGYSWSLPVSPDAVRRWRQTLDAAG